MLCIDSGLNALAAAVLPVPHRKLIPHCLGLSSSKATLGSERTVRSCSVSSVCPQHSVQGSYPIKDEESPPFW